MNDPDRSENYRTCGVIRTVSKRGLFHTVYELIHEPANRGKSELGQMEKKTRKVNLMSVWEISWEVTF